MYLRELQDCLRPNFIKIALGRLDENDALFRKLLDDAEFQEAVRDFYAKEVYRRSRHTG